MLRKQREVKKTNRTIYIGIDPGKSGAVVVKQHTVNKTIISFYDMPLFGDKQISGKGLFHILHPLKDESLFRNCPIVCGLEKAQAMPKQGGTGMFTYGKGYGKILACLEILSIKTIEIRPAAWKKVMNIPSSKEGLRKNKKIKLNHAERKSIVTTVAKSLYPQCQEQFYNKRGTLMDGRVEALLIADYVENHL